MCPLVRISFCVHYSGSHTPFTRSFRLVRENDNVEVVGVPLATLELLLRPIARYRLFLRMATLHMTLLASLVELSVRVQRTGEGLAALPCPFLGFVSTKHAF